MSRISCATDDDDRARRRRASRRGAVRAARVHERVHVVEQPLVGARRPVEPGRVVEADHALDVAVEVERPAAEPGPVGREAEQRGVQVRVVGERRRDAEPDAVRRLARAVGARLASAPTRTRDPGPGPPSGSKRRRAPARRPRPAGRRRTRRASTSAVNEHVRSSTGLSNCVDLDAPRRERCGLRGASARGRRAGRVEVTGRRKYACSECSRRPSGASRVAATIACAITNPPKRYSPNQSGASPIHVPSPSGRSVRNSIVSASTASRSSAGRGRHEHAPCAARSTSERGARRASRRRCRRRPPGRSARSGRC